MATGDSDFTGTVLGILMITFGISPTVLFLLGLTARASFISNFGVVLDQSFVSMPIVQLIVSITGLFLAGMGVLTIKYGRSEIDTPGLY
ncbi:hypothetical protein SAMN05421858_1746 [Haladaptatus litoreus]|uniref:Uncharacterized protein n=1 Tax=Haladaptatus litoreus TaxID=553468 RepID=A0A1N6YW82_9EURY|nr:hypothetical protein [Haladaptatus litoreus]SIR18857.1 hypothetical protein SAMN05421858_1746 [Haladaptatus litoreus]